MTILDLYRKGSLAISALTLVLLAGCSSSDTDIAQSLTDTSSTAPVEQGPSPQALAEQRRREQMLTMTVYYFDFDKSELKQEAFESLRYHAQQLKENSAMTVRLEGHADERGTPEYNLALGERRAIAVQRFLQVQGVASSQLEVISYGEERPVARGTGEANWRQNRRVELKY